MTLSTERYLPIAGLCLRGALAMSYLSAVADRFGMWGAAGTGNVAWGSFDAFLAYTGLLLPFLPAAMIPIFGWVATVAEVLIALGLLAGYQLRWIAIASAGLLFSFAAAMSLSLGWEPALSYSVWTACAASLVLACLPETSRREEGK